MTETVQFIVSCLNDAPFHMKLRLVSSNAERYTALSAKIENVKEFPTLMLVNTVLKLVLEDTC